MYPDPALRRPARPVQAGSKEAQEAVERLKEAFNPETALGLAANQIGLPVRVIIVRLDDEIRVLLNPEIVHRTQGLVVEPEGCLSLPGVEAEVARAGQVVVKAQDEEGRPVELELDGLWARLLQHEVDHLDGILFIDHLSSEERRWVLQEYRAGKGGSVSSPL